MKFNWNLSLLLLGLIVAFSSCQDDEMVPEPENEEEVITTLTYTLTPTSGGDAVTFVFRDLDGDGGNDPEITNGTLAANTAYTGAITLENEEEGEDITAEINEEQEEHQFFFQTTVAGLTVEYADTDANNNPVGLSSTLTTADEGQGNLTITLRHEPAKSASGVAGGDITNAGGETDIEVTFSVTVQ